MHSPKITIFSGVVLLFFAVLIGAFGAHALSDLLTENNRVDVFNTASRYHFYHGFALILLGVIGRLYKNFVLPAAMFLCFLFGALIFSGSLYLLAVLNIGWLGAITPIGGTLLLVAWGMFAYNLYFYSKDLE